MNYRSQPLVVDMWNCTDVQLDKNKKKNTFEGRYKHFSLFYLSLSQLKVCELILFVI